MTRGCRRRSSQSSCSGSAKTMSAMRPRSTWPSGPKTPSPKRSRTAARTSSSERSRSWTISSLEITAAPWRANAPSASDFPAPIPPVTATATGRALGGLFFLRRSRIAALGVAGTRIFRRHAVGLDALVGLLGRRFLDEALLGDGLLSRARSQGLPGDGLLCHVFGEDFLGEAQLGGPLADPGAAFSFVDPLQGEGQATPLRIHLDDLRAHRLTLGHDLARVLDVVLRQLGDVNKPLDARHDFDEGAEGDHLRHLPFDDVPLVVHVHHLLPGVRLGLLQAERDALPLAVDVEHLDLHFLADLEQLRGMVYVTPGELGDVDEPVDALEVHEGAEVDDVGDGPRHDIAGRETVEDRLAHLLALLLEDGAAREHDIVAAAVELDHLTAQRLAHELVEVLDAADVHERGGQKPTHAQIEDQPALHDLDHRPFDGLSALRRPLDALPRHFETGALLREDKATLGVLLRHHERVDLVTDVDFVGRVDRTSNRQLRNRDDALGLVADVDQDFVLVDAYDLAAHDLALVDDGEGRVVVGDQFAVGTLSPDVVV